MSCPFTPYVSRYRGRAKVFKQHLRHCQHCRTAALFVVASVEDAELTPNCPDEAILGSYSEGLLDQLPEHGDVVEHVQSCPCCLWRVLEAKRQGADQETVAAAMLAGNAYVLAERLSAFLATEVFPLEELAVKGGFDASYDATSRELEERATEEPASAEPVLLRTGLADPSGTTLAQRINMIASQIGLHRLSTSASLPAIAELLEQRRAHLTGAGLGGRLLDETIRWLRNQPSDSF